MHATDINYSYLLMAPPFAAWLLLSGRFREASPAEAQAASASGGAPDGAAQTSARGWSTIWVPAIIGVVAVFMILVAITNP